MSISLEIKNNKKLLVAFLSLLLLSVFSLKIVNAKSDDTKIYIDVPYSTQQVDGKLNYQGWVMSEYKNAKVKVYVDGEEQSNPTRYVREDVLSAISGYGGRITNSKPGFKGSIDVSSYALGSSHTFKVDVLVNNEVVESMSTTFKIGTPSTKIEIDKPVQNQSVKTTLDIEGWVMSEDSGASVEIYVDGSKASTTTRYAREDVLSAISGYGGRTTNSKPGFKTTLDMSKYTDGVHNIEMKVISSGGNVISTCSRVVNVKKYDTKIYIDVPYSTQQVDGKLNYQGWVMSEYKNAKVKVYVDGEEQSNPTRYVREDVLSAISGYGGRITNSKPGFKGSIDVSSYALGSSHTFKVDVLVNNEVVESMSTTFKIGTPSTKIEIDKPVQNQSVKTTLDIEGWVMSEDSGASVEIYVDGSKASTTTRYAREDVLSAISGYGGRTTNSKPGFKTTLDMSKYTDGVHNIEMKVISSGGNVISTCSRVVNVKKYDTKIEIDSPINQSFFKENIEYQGWVMSEDSGASVKVYVDDVEQNAPTRYVREDVLSAISGYGGRTTNSKPGYKGSINYENLSEGYHTLKIEAIASTTGEVISSVSTKFFLRKYNTKIEIESPVNNSTKKTSIDIKGWIMSEDRDGSIEIYIDNEKIDTISLIRTKRDDVLNSVNGYGDSSTNPNPGYEMTIDSSEMKDGLHNYKIVYVSSESSDVTTSVSSNFYIKKYDGMVYLDDPVGTNFSSNFTIRGWAMAECSNSRLEVYLDNNLLSVERTERQDVIDSVKDYGTALENPTPGFITTLDIANYSEGMHTITIKLYSFKNELIDSYEKRISISKGRYFGVDVSEHNGYINWSYMRSAGIDYAYIRAGIRGYTEGKIVNDDNVYTNLDGCLSSGIKCGVYLFSQAINYSEGVEEADFIINLLENSNYHTRISLPIAIDTEWSNNNHDGRADFLTKLQRTEAVKGFIDEVAARNYRPMIYASTDWFSNNLDMSQLGNADIWVADWRGYNGYQGPYQVWQYGGGDGPSYGVSSAGIDLNYFYKKY